jgi:hypothetical protein
MSIATVRGGVKPAAKPISGIFRPYTKNPSTREQIMRVISKPRFSRVDIRKTVDFRI